MATKAEIDLLMNLKGNVLSALTQVQGQLRNFSTTFKAGFNLNLGAQAANFLLSLPSRFKAITEEIDNLKTTAENANIGVEAFQALEAIAARSNVSMEELFKTFTKIRAVNQAFADQDQGIIAAFETLGIEGKKFAELPLPLQLEELGRAYASAGNEANKFTALTEIFGEKIGPKLQALLRDLGANGFGALADDVKDVGQVIEKTTTTTLGDLNDRLDELGKRLKNLFARIAEDFAPLADRFIQFGNLLLSVAERAEIAFKRVLRAIGGVVSVVSGETTFAEANKMLNEAALEDDRKRSAPVDPGPRSTPPDPNQQRLISNLRNRILSEEEKAQLESLTSRGEVIARETGFQLAAISRDFTRSAEQRKNAVAAVLRAELSDIASLQNQLSALVDSLDENDPRKEKFQRALERARDRRTEVTQEILTTTSGPQTIGEGALAGTIAILDQIGSKAEQVSRAMATTLGSAVSGISDGLFDMLAGVDGGWSKAWLNFRIAAARAFTDMVAEYALKKAAMFAIDLAYSAKGLTLSIASAAKSLVAWIPSAIAASISSWGTAAAVGSAAALAAVAVANFSDGGAVRGPGTGTSDSIHARLSNGEFVFSARSVQAIGLDRLDALHRAGRGYAQGGLVGAPLSVMAPAPARSRGSNSGITLIAVDSRSDAERIRKNSPGLAEIFEYTKSRRHELLG